MPRARVCYFAMEVCSLCTLLAAGLNLACQRCSVFCALVESAIKTLSHKCLRRWRFRAPVFILAARRQVSSRARGHASLAACNTPLGRLPDGLIPWRPATLHPLNKLDLSDWQIKAQITEPKPAKETTAYDREGPRRLTVAIGAARVRVVASGPVQSTSSASRALCARGGPRCTREAPRRMKQTRDAIAARTAAETLTDP